MAILIISKAKFISSIYSRLIAVLAIHKKTAISKKALKKFLNIYQSLITAVMLDERQIRYLLLKLADFLRLRPERKIRKKYKLNKNVKKITNTYNEYRKRQIQAALLKETQKAWQASFMELSEQITSNIKKIAALKQGSY